MGFWRRLFGRGKNSRADPPIHTGRIADSTSRYAGSLSPYRSRTTDILAELRRIPDEADAVDFLRKKVPDVSMALWNFVRLSNQGHQMKFYDANNPEKQLTELEDDWRDFASRVNEISNAGLDGLINILHTSAYLFGNQIIEVEVNDDRTDIVDVHVIDPRTISWELEERKGRKIWIPYQQQALKGRVSLENANLFSVPTDPDINDPRGNLLLAPALQPTDFQMQVLQDLQTVLHRQGWPRNDISIDREAIAKTMPAEYKYNALKQLEWYEKIFGQVKKSLYNQKPDSDYIHFDDVTVNMTGGANANRSLDVRAVTETVDVQILNALKQLGTFANRHSGKTETYSTVEFSITIQGIKSTQRGSKRLIEEIARLWLRVRGIQAIPVFTHNDIDYVSELQRMDIKLRNQEFWAKNMFLKLCSPDKAAQEIIGADGAYSQDYPEEQIRISLSAGEGLNDDQHKRKSGLPKESLHGEKVSYLRQKG
jgi:hypothetical protein